MKHAFLTIIFLFFHVTSSIAGDCSVANCEQLESYQEHLTFILFDSTTIPNERSIERYSDGIRQIVFSNQTKGKIELYSIGDKPHTINKLFTTCIPPNEKIETTTEEGWSISKYKDIEAWKKLLIPEPPSRHKYDKCKSSKSVIEVREDVRNAIITKSISNIKETKTTCLINDLVLLIKDRGQSYKTLNIYVFTDLQDSIHTPWIKQNKSEQYFHDMAINLANKYSNQSVTNHNNLVPQTNIYFWGIGRDEISSNSTVNHTVLNKLMIFWETFIYHQKLANNVQFHYEFPDII